MPMIKIEHLNYTYPDGLQAIKGISLEIQEGEKVGLIGPNGAGKSTLLTLLNGVRKGEGNITIAGIEMSPRTVKQIRSLVGLVFQDPEDQLFCPTVYEEVAFAPLNYDLAPDEVEKRVKETLSQVGLSGYEHRATFHLSFGEKKTVALASVLSYRPKILLFDEPSSDLDLRQRRRIIEFIRNLNNTIVIATHDLDMVLELCPRCIIINHGKITADNGTKEILLDEPLLNQNGLELPISCQQKPL